MGVEGLPEARAGEPRPQEPGCICSRARSVQAAVSQGECLTEAKGSKSHF